MAASRAEPLATSLLAVLLLMPVAGSAANAAAPAPSTDRANQTPGVGPAPEVPAELFTMAPAPRCPQQVCFWANSNQPGVAAMTATRTHMVMVNPEFVDTTRGVSHITADHGEESGADIANSQIVLTGDVHTDMAQGQLSANTATVLVVDRRISSIVAQGNPARFLRRGTPPATAAPASGAQAPGSHVAGSRSGGTQAGSGTGSASTNAALASQSVYGHADSITYDLKADTVQLDGNSWLTDGCNEFTSQRITYNLASQTVEAGPEPGSQGRVYGTIRNTRPGASCTAAGRS